ncbi:MAG: peptide chain release factor 2 [Verrucomicrobiota bacterium]|nr:peptide chain release factor 2 [Verrucomicrobiota bacterium]
MQLITPEVRSQIKDISRRAGQIWRYLDGEKKLAKIAALEEKMAAPNFWEDQQAAQKVINAANRMKAAINPSKAFNLEVSDLNALLELVDEIGDDSEQLIYEQEVIDLVESLQSKLDALELASFLTGPHDSCNAILTVHAGAGGTESCDWADMLLRMYSRWAERSGFTVDIQDIMPGEEAGISSATIRIEGPNAYGYAKAERGVHRLVRISPFDSNARRHTSFSSVDVIAEIEDDIDMDIPETEIRTDVYRASGKGGQHVNRNESALRLTHIPSNIVVTCQNERSQIKNKATALRTLKSRLYEKMLDDKRSEMEKFYGEKGDIAWGNQIRSYVFQPYQLVTDLRTGIKEGNVQGVMDGELDAFVHAWLRAGGPTSRKSAGDREFGDE